MKQIPINKDKLIENVYKVEFEEKGFEPSARSMWLAGIKKTLDYLEQRGYLKFRKEANEKDTK